MEIIALGLILVVYFLPWIVALMRASKRTGGVFVINLFLGWTLLFWVIALAWAAGSDTHEERT
ncbi:MAG: superinfection immunity protein [Rhodobacterales bacterium]|nr:superinfection immunity protein [Rhodobacterales bacterium]